MTNTTRRFRRAHVVVLLVTAALAVLGTGRLASAHTDFESSAPSDGDVVDGPLTEVVVNFSNPAQPNGEGFELLDPNGVVRTPSVVDETDGTSFVLSFDPPLQAGTYGLRWSVRAGDAHPIEGSFRFQVVTTIPTSTASAPSPDAAVPSSVPTTTVVAVADETASPPSTRSGAGSASLDEFLSAGTTGEPVAAGRAGRMVSMLGTIFGIGVLAALMWTIRGDRSELLSLLTWVRIAGLVVFTGGLIEYAALAETDPSVSFGTLTATKQGLAVALKMAGGLAVLLGFHRRAGRFTAPVRSLSAAVATDLSAQDEVSAPTSFDEHRWTPTSTAALGLFGYALVLVSFWFDGHTTSRGPWAIHSVVNLVHLTAAAVWGGGVFAMTAVAWMRRRRSEPSGLGSMVVRFSSIATASLVAVIVAGSAMAWMILDVPGDLFGTEWGRVLVAKTTVVAVAAGLGGFNHFRLRPALEHRPDDQRLAKELRVSLSVEAAVFVVIVVITAILVASAT